MNEPIGKITVETLAVQDAFFYLRRACDPSNHDSLDGVFHRESRSRALMLGWKKAAALLASTGARRPRSLKDAPDLLCKLIAYAEARRIDPNAGEFR